MVGDVFVFFKQKTAYEMRISDCSSDVCSSDLVVQPAGAGVSRRSSAAAGTRRAAALDRARRGRRRDWRRTLATVGAVRIRQRTAPATRDDRKSGVEGQRVTVRAVAGGSRSINNTKSPHQNRYTFPKNKT